MGNQTETIVVIIAGNPRGLISCHHEKLLLIDPECSNNCMAFTGGFDVARGRYDQPEHKIYSPSMQLDPSVNIPECSKHKNLDIQQNSRIFTSCSIRFMRNWNGSF